MADTSNSVMVALLPTQTDWCTIDLPHMTLVYAGEIPDLMLGAQNELAKMALTLAVACHKIKLVVMGVEVFGGGDQEMVDVLILRPEPELVAMRHVLENWNASEHPFRPHATIGPMGSAKDVIPDYLVFDRICVAWGDKLLTYKLLE